MLNLPNLTRRRQIHKNGKKAENKKQHKSVAHLESPSACYHNPGFAHGSPLSVTHQEMSRRHLSQTAEPFQLTLFYKNVQQSYGGLQEASTAPHSVVPQATVPSAGGQESEQAVVGV